MHAKVCFSANVQSISRARCLSAAIPPALRQSSLRRIGQVTPSCLPFRAESSGNEDDREDLEYFRSGMEPMASNPGYCDESRTPSSPWDFLEHLDQFGHHNSSAASPSFGIDLLLLGPYSHVQNVYAILFGDQGKEGIYSLRRSSNGEDSFPLEIIITFESEEDASRYALLLEATMDRTPQVSMVPVDGLCHFCEEHGYKCRMQPAGCLLFPPSFNVMDTDWERSERLRNGQWSVMPAEPHIQSESSAERATATTRATTLWGISDLDEIKARLENLLPPGNSTDDISSDDVTWKYK